MREYLATTSLSDLIRKSGEVEIESTPTTSATEAPATTGLEQLQQLKILARQPL